MEDFYVKGVVIAFLIGLVKVGVAANFIFSLRARNLAKIGLYYACFSGNFTSKDKVTFPRFAWFAVYLLVIAPIFSWLSVGSAVWSFISAQINKTNVPEKIKEVQYRITHIDLTGPQMIEAQEEIAKALGVSGPIRTGEASDEDFLTLVLEKGSWNSTLRVDPSNKTLNYYSAPDDCSTQNYQKFLYRFENEGLFVSLIESYANHYGKIDYDVKDGVILEHEIRKRLKEKKFQIEQIDEKIAKIKNQLGWVELVRNDIKFFTMRSHPESFPLLDLRRAIRHEIQRNKVGLERLIQAAKELGAEVLETDLGLTYRYPENASPEEIEKLELYFSDANLREKFGVTFQDIDHYRIQEPTFLMLLGEKLE